MSVCLKHITEEKLFWIPTPRRRASAPKVRRRPNGDGFGECAEKTASQTTPKVYTDTRQPTPVGLAFAGTGYAPWPLYQGLGKTGSCEGRPGTTKSQGRRKKGGKRGWGSRIEGSPGPVHRNRWETGGKSSARATEYHGVLVWRAPMRSNSHQGREPWARMNTPVPTPVRQLFNCTGDAPWPLYQGLGEEGFMTPLKGGRSTDGRDGGWGG